MKIALIFFFGVVAFFFTTAKAAYAIEKLRAIILTDIGGDPDDQQSMVRLMLYSNEFDIEGLVATSRMIHGHDTKPELIRNIITAYGSVRENLLLHDENYPPALRLASLVKSGNPVPGLNSAIKGKLSGGSNQIISVVDQNDPRPVWVLVWGGSGPVLTRQEPHARSPGSNSASERMIRSGLTSVSAGRPSPCASIQIA